LRVPAPHTLTIRPSNDAKAPGAGLNARICRSIAPAGAFQSIAASIRES
jgi:hypothetical protein